MDDGNGGGLVAGAFGMVFMLVMMVVLVICIVGMWKLFEKAGKPGWACLIPFYREWLLMEILGFPGYYFLIMFVPFVGFLFALYCMYKLPLVFGKDMIWGIAAIFLAPLVMLALGFGDAQYQGSGA